MSDFETNVYQWTFEIKDVIQFSEATITVTSGTYEQAIRKIKAMKLPQLKTFDDIDEGIKLTQVYEVEGGFNTGDPEETEPKDNEDDD